jgi:hypothetical protein
MHARFVSVAILAALLSLFSGCWVAERAIDSALGSAASTAGNRVGESVGNQVGASAAARVNMSMGPMMMGVVFAMAFNGGGYAMNQNTYKPGEWTRWNFSSGDEGHPTTMERAYLFDDKDGNSWWKVKWNASSSDGKDETMIFEALLDKTNMKMLRMRQKMPNETEGKEVPVSEQTYYVPPTKLTKQSLEGGLKGTENVTVPAGSYSAKHYQFTDNGGGAIDYWIVDTVPGGMVKQVHTPNGSSKGQTVELTATGSGAKSELGVAP